MSGAIGLEQLKKLPNFLKQRRKNAETFINLFSDHPFIRIQKSIGESSWFGFSLILEGDFPKTRSEVISILTEHNIDSDLSSLVILLIIKFLITLILRSMKIW